MTINTGLVGLIIVLLDIWAIIKILGSAATTGRKSLWILLIVLLPMVGLVLWALAGPSSGRPDKGLPPP